MFVSCKKIKIAIYITDAKTKVLIIGNNML